MCRHTVELVSERDGPEMVLDRGRDVVWLSVCARRQTETVNLFLALGSENIGDGDSEVQLFAETMSFGLRLRERDQREKIEKIRNSVLPSGQSVGVHSVRKTFEVNVP